MVYRLPTWLPWPAAMLAFFISCGLVSELFRGLTGVFVLLGALLIVGSTYGAYRGTRRVVEM